MSRGVRRTPLHSLKLATAAPDHFVKRQDHGLISTLQFRRNYLTQISLVGSRESTNFACEMQRELIEPKEPHFVVARFET